MDMTKKIIKNKLDMMKALDNDKTIWQTSLTPRTGEAAKLITYVYYYHKYDKDCIIVHRLISGDGTGICGSWCKTINLDDMWNEEDTFYYYS